MLYIGVAFSVFITSFYTHADSQINLSAEETEWLAQHPVIRLCVDPDYAPVEYLHDNKHLGITSDYYDIIAKRLNVTFTVEHRDTWQSCLSDIKQDKVDVIATIKRTTERQTYLSFTEPYISDDVVIITQNLPVLQGEQTITDFYGKKVAVVNGYFYHELLPAEHPEIQIVPVNSTESGLVAVAFGSADAFFSSYPVVTHYMKEKGIANLSVSGKTPYQTDYAAGVRKDWGILASILDKAFKSISTKEKNDILSSWITVEHKTPWYNKRLVIALLSGAGFLLLLGSLWVAVLRREVKLQTQALKTQNDKLELTITKRNEQLEESNRILRAISEVDGLTQVANRRYLNNELEKLISQSRQELFSLAVFMIDVDYFRPYNDFYGHVEGDKTLFRIAQQLKLIAQGYNGFVARYNGEKFTMVIHNDANRIAASIAEAILAGIRDIRIPHERSPISDDITISIGGCVIPPEQNISLEDMLKLADQQLNTAKSSGRDQFFIAVANESVI